MAGGWQGFLKECRAPAGWRTVVSSGIGYGLSVNVLPYFTIGVFSAALERDFGWSRTQIQASIAWFVAATLSSSWVAGWLIDRHGVRRVAAVGQVAVAVGLAMLGLNQQNLGAWYATWFLMCLIGQGTGPISWTRAVAGRFDVGRGFALSIALGFSGITAIVAPAAVAEIIAHHNWRYGYFAMAAVVLLVGVPSTLFLMPRESARRAGDTLAAPDLPGRTVAQALANRGFWLMMLSTLLLAFAITGLIPNLAPIVVRNGMEATAAASLMGVFGVTVIIGRIATGLALDRYWAPLVAAVILPLPAVTCLIFASGANGLTLNILAVILLGLCTGAEFDVLPYLVSRYFGVRRYSQIYAFLWIAWTSGGGIAPAIFGLNFDLAGSYGSVLHAAAACFVVAPLLLLALGPYPRFSEPDEQEWQAACCNDKEGRAA